MNLRSVANGITQSVNPNQTLTVDVSTGATDTDDGIEIPTYATPGEYTGSLSGGVLTITVATKGTIKVGQTLLGASVVPNTRVLSYLTGTGGVGTYQVSGTQILTSQALTTAMLVPGNVQPMSFRDLAQLDGLNLQGTQYAIYLYGRIEGIVRSSNKGGDLITDAAGRRYLVVKVLEQWGELVWCKVAATLQNGG